MPLFERPILSVLIRNPYFSDLLFVRIRSGSGCRYFSCLGIVDEITGLRRNRVYRYSPFLDVLTDDADSA